MFLLTVFYSNFLSLIISFDITYPCTSFIITIYFFFPSFPIPPLLIPSLFFSPSFTKSPLDLFLLLSFFIPVLHPPFIFRFFYSSSTPIPLLVIAIDSQVHVGECMNKHVLRPLLPVLFAPVSLRVMSKWKKELEWRRSWRRMWGWKRWRT